MQNVRLKQRAAAIMHRRRAVRSDSSGEEELPARRQRRAVSAAALALVAVPVAVPAAPSPLEAALASFAAGTGVQEWTEFRAWLLRQLADGTLSYKGVATAAWTVRGSPELKVDDLAEPPDCKNAARKVRAATGMNVLEDALFWADIPVRRGPYICCMRVYCTRGASGLRQFASSCSLAEDAAGRQTGSSAPFPAYA